jgi:uncharacterized protein (DUF58 family)
MFKLFLKKWIFFFVIIVFSLIIGLQTSIVFFHFFFWFLVSIAVLNLTWLAIVYFGTRLNLTRNIISKMEEEDILEVEVSIENNSFSPIFNLVLEDYLSCAESKDRKKLILIEFLRPKSFSNLKYNCLCPLRGRYDIGPFIIYFFDPFGLFFLKKTFYIYSELYVYPKTFAIRKFPELIKGMLPWFGIETTRASGDEDEFFGVREYKEGDPIKKIHWISTARKNRLIVKQFQRQSFFRATIILNLQKDKNIGEGKERVAEYMIKIAASIAKYLIARGVSLEIVAHTGEIIHIPFNKGQEHLEDIMKFLAIAQAESRVGLGEIFEEFSRYIPDYSSLIAIMPDTDWEFLPSMLLLEKRDISIIPFVVMSSTFLYPSDKQRILKDTGIKFTPTHSLNPLFFCRGDNLEEVFKY